MLDRLIKTRTCARMARNARKSSLPISFKFGFSFRYYLYFSRQRGVISSLA